jgi:glutathione S-transferase
MVSAANSESDDRVLYAFWLSPYLSFVAQVLTEVGLHFVYERVSPFIGDTYSEPHQVRNPLRKIPSMREPDGLIVSESQAICRYLARRYPEARSIYPCDDPVRCARVDVLSDFLTFSVSGPFFNWFVVGAYYPQAFRLKTEAESATFSQLSMVMVRGALGRLVNGAEMQPFLLGSEPMLPDFHLFYILELGKTFAAMFDMPLINVLAGDDALQRFYDAMEARPATADILTKQRDELPLTRREIFEEFGTAVAPMLQQGRPALAAMFGHEV